ncbi:MAG: hypothetical protein K6A89_12265 [Treponema sp.]|nr:hypothetical protein [Treponema sp.]
MQFGMPTLIENKSLKENIELCSRLGLNFIELNMNLPERLQLAKERNARCVLETKTIAALEKSVEYLRINNLH